MNTANKIIFKNKMLEVCILKQQSLVNDFQERLHALTESENWNEELYDNADLATNVIKTDEVNTLNEALSFAIQELRLLENLKTTQAYAHERASLGSVVVTDHNTFFVSVSIENFEIDDHSYIGISLHSPIFKAMAGKKKGESFTYKGIDYKIKEVF